MRFLHPESEYAVWDVPGASKRVYYLLSLFHEIDFQVNEGFRRIPHGGIEVGGLVFGAAEANAIRIDAFRPIACEHSRGPSFLLSERDLDTLRAQIAAAPSDPELKDLELVGWFVAHTRSPLELNETEASLFYEFLPEGKLMVLIKPERFQPTRFLFLARDGEGKLSGGGTENAIILPLPGRAQRANKGAAESIAAPAEKPATTAPVVPRTPPVESEERPEQVAQTSPEKTEPVAPSREELAPVEEIRRRRSEIFSKPEPVERPVSQQVTQPISVPRRRSSTQLVIVLFIAAALGCGVGYTIYLQLPPAVIPLSVQSHAPVLVISWPPEQTRDAVYAVLRIDDGDPIALSAQQKERGQAEIPSKNGNVKVELIAQHWMRDSRGIVRYVGPVRASPAASSAGGLAQ